MRTASLAAPIRLADAAAIGEAARILAQGGLVAFPTETVYGLGTDAGNANAVARLFAAKGRPHFNPLIVHVPDVADAEQLAVFDPVARRLTERFWPGPLTLVLPRAAGCPVAAIATAGLATVAVRVPRHPIASALLRAAGRPIVAPSANRSGLLSPTEASHVAASLGRDIDLILDGGRTEVGVESTVVACLEGKVALLRPGGIPSERIAEVLERELLPSHDPGDQPLSPGLLASHYAPTKPIRLRATDIRAGEALLAFGPALPPLADGAGPVLNLSPGADLVEAAANLFAHLHQLDRSEARTIAVMDVPDHGLGRAINDRLRRAATTERP